MGNDVPIDCEAAQIVDIEEGATIEELHWLLSGVPLELQFDVISYGGGFPPLGEFEQQLSIAAPIWTSKGDRFYWRQVSEQKKVRMPSGQEIRRDGFNGLDFSILLNGPLVDFDGYELSLSPEGALSPEQWELFRNALRIRNESLVYTLDVAWHVVQEERRDDWRAIFERKRVGDLNTLDLPLMIWPTDRRWFLSSQWDSWWTILCVSGEDARKVYSEPGIEVL